MNKKYPNLDKFGYLLLKNCDSHEKHTYCRSNFEDLHIVAIAKTKSLLVWPEKFRVRFWASRIFSEDIQWLTDQSCPSILWKYAACVHVFLQKLKISSKTPIFFSEIDQHGVRRADFSDFENKKSSKFKFNLTGVNSSWLESNNFDSSRVFREFSTRVQLESEHSCYSSSDSSQLELTRVKLTRVHPLILRALLRSYELYLFVCGRTAMCKTPILPKKIFELDSEHLAAVFRIVKKVKSKKT